MFRLGVLLADENPAEARRWYERAADAGDTGAMFRLGVLLADEDPAQAR
jgi:TPR repeat protein